MIFANLTDMFTATKRYSGGIEKAKLPMQKNTGRKSPAATTEMYDSKPFANLHNVHILLSFIIWIFYYNNKTTGNPTNGAIVILASRLAEVIFYLKKRKHNRH